MEIKNLPPKEAHQAMSSEPDHVFIDVRTPEEYEAGHPEGAINIPWALHDPATGRMTPNPDFVPTVKKHARPPQSLYLSCLSGVRSMNACRDLQAAGYAKLTNVDCGFGGKRDFTGRVVAPGWQASGLPVGTEGRSYEELRGEG